MKTFARVMVIIGLLVLGAIRLRGDETHARYFEQLRQRGLYSLAESEAVARLASEDLPLASRIEFSVELSRTLAEHAGYVSDEQRNDYWFRATKIVQDLLDRDPSNARAIFLSAQLAAVQVHSGDWLRAEREVRPFDELLLVQARTACTKAIELLNSLERSFSDSSPKKAGGGVLLGHELRTLSHQVKWQLALAYRNRAELAPLETDDRKRDLNEAEQTVRKLISVADEPLQTRARLLLAVCLRLKNERERASDALIALEKTGSKSIELAQDEITTERVRLLLDQKRVTEAAEVLLKSRGLRQRLTGEMWFLQTKALVGLRMIALEKQQEILAERLAEQIVTTLDRCEEQVGGFWNRRCRQYWDNVRTAQKYGAELDTLMQQARSDYTSGRIDPSLTKYELAEKLALKQGQVELAMELGFTRASILMDDLRFESAEIEFFRLASEYANQPRAAKAHLLGTYCLGRLYDDRRTQSRRIAYNEALDRHLEKFAHDVTVNDARFLKAQFEEQRLQSSVALPLYLQVDSDHPRALDAMLGAARCYETILRRIIEKRLATEELEREAVTRLTAFLTTSDDADEKWTVAHAEIALRLASILLLNGADGTAPHPSENPRPAGSDDSDPWGAANRYHQADRWLARVTVFIERHKRDGVVNENIDRLKIKVVPLRVVALTGSGNLIDAEKSLRLLPQSTRENLNVLERLGQFTAASSGIRRTQIALLQLNLIERMAPLRDQLSEAETEQLERLTFNAYVSAGQIIEAMPIGKKLSEQSAKDAAKQRDLAIVLSEIPQQDAQNLAKQCWRRVEMLTKGGSPEWMAARLGILSACIQLKQVDEARKLLQVTKVLYPDVKPEILKARLNALESELQAIKTTAP